jgi:hypothetical protein
MSKKLTEFDYHELLDRTSIIMLNIDTYLVNHQASKGNKEIKNKLEEARTLLFEAYQMINEKY